MTTQDYCKKCDAPHKPAFDVLMRCGLCHVINGKLPPTKFVLIKEPK